MIVWRSQNLLMRISSLLKLLAMSWILAASADADAWAQNSSTVRAVQVYYGTVFFSQEMGFYGYRYETELQRLFLASFDANIQGTRLNMGLEIDVEPMLRDAETIRTDYWTDCDAKLIDSLKENYAEATWDPRTWVGGGEVADSLSEWGNCEPTLEDRPVEVAPTSNLNQDTKLILVDENYLCQLEKLAQIERAACNRN